jgi:hypothetical protein
MTVRRLLVSNNCVVDIWPGPGLSAALMATSLVSQQRLAYHWISQALILLRRHIGSRIAGAHQLSTSA